MFVAGIAIIGGADAPLLPLILFTAVVRSRCTRGSFAGLPRGCFVPFGGVDLPELPIPRADRTARLLRVLLDRRAVAGFLFIIRALGGDAGPETIVFLGGNAAVGAIVAVLSIIAPSGLGVREGAMYGLVLAVAPSGIALGAVVLNRIVITVVEGLLLLVGEALVATSACRAEQRARDALVVVGVFGPTASGKTDVAETLADLLDAELVSADAMQAYRGLPILTNQSERPTRLVGIWPLEHDASVGEYQELAQAAIDELVAAGRVPVVVGGTGLYLRAALAGLELPPPHLPRCAPGSSACTTGSGLSEPTPRWSSATPPQPRAFTRTTADGWSGHSSSPSSGRRSRPPRTRSGAGGTGIRRRGRARLPRDELASRIEARTRSMVERGVVEEARRALAGSVSQTALTIHGLRDFAELPLEEAVETYNRRVRRYAAYQRKWMRRIPGVVIIDANRPATEVADEIVALARARERVPGDGAVPA